MSFGWAEINPLRIFGGAGIATIHFHNKFRILLFSMVFTQTLERLADKRTSTFREQVLHSPR